LIGLPNGRVELYHLADDPGEMHDVSTAYPKIAAQLGEELSAWKAENERLRTGLLRRRQSAASLDLETRRKLEAAGYLQ
jgi:hypothetical protein